MCLQATRVRAHQSYRWAGDEIVHEPIVPAARRVPTARGARGYPVDIREFLGLAGSALIRQHIENLEHELEAVERRLFRSRERGAFDFRAQAVLDFVGRRMRYIPGTRRADDWLVPAETLAAGGGDCEDLAFLLAAMLEQSGISSYCLRVAFGTITELDSAGGTRSWDHAWVVYMNEGGAWEILEPLAVVAKRERRARQKTKPRRRSPTDPRLARDFDYTPHFVLNRQHLWRVRSSDSAATRPLSNYLTEREFFGEFDPSFAASVHNSTFRDALIGIAPADLSRIERSSLVVDANALAYDPRDHFDFAYIDQGWTRVGQRLRSGSLEDLALALHAIGDFYAHSTYADFGMREPGSDELLPYDPRTKVLRQTPNYDFERYVPIPGSRKSPADAAALWQGKLISGQWWRWYTTYPDDIQGAKELALRRTLPDHDLIAVDGATPRAAHRRYDEAEFAIQFADRRNAAVTHMRSVWLDWKARFCA